MAPLYLPELVLQMLRAGMDCVISVSGGKDSQALLMTFVLWFQAQGFAGKLSVVHADLGRAERTETPGFIATLCAQFTLPLQIVYPVVNGTRGDLQDGLERRMTTLAGTGKPFWPTRGLRYCTAMKRDACDKELRHSPLVLSLEGIRANESEERAEKVPLSVRKVITGERYKHLTPNDAWTRYQTDRSPVQYQFFNEEPEQGKRPRLALTLYPLFFWSLDQVWTACGTSQEELDERRVLYMQGIDRQDAGLRAAALLGWPAHPAYVKGSKRLSCSLCILADLSTLRSGAYNNPAYYRALVWMEIESGFSFQQQRWVCDVAPDLLTDEQRHLLEKLPQRLAWRQKKQRTFTLSTKEISQCTF